MAQHPLVGGWIWVHGCLWATSSSHKHQSGWEVVTYSNRSSLITRFLSRPHDGKGWGLQVGVTLSHYNATCFGFVTLFTQLGASGGLSSRLCI